MSLIEHRFSPYADNGGTCVGVSGPSQAVLIADTRLSKGYSIHSRKCSKVTQLTSKCCIASCGMKADAITLHKVLKIRLAMYEHEHRKEMSITAIAQMLSTILYGKRFFPYYTFNVLAGIDEEGKGGVYHYDAIGNFERIEVIDDDGKGGYTVAPFGYTTSGSGSALAHAVLDQQISEANVNANLRANKNWTTEEITSLCKDVLCSTGERDIYTGDGAEIFVIDASGVQKHSFLPSGELKPGLLLKLD